MFRFTAQAKNKEFTQKVDPFTPAAMDWDAEDEDAEMFGSNGAKGIVTPGQTIASSHEFMRYPTYSYGLLLADLFTGAMAHLPMGKML